MKYLIIFLTILFSSCKPITETVLLSESPDLNDNNIVLGKPFIDYDKIEYYNIDIKGDTIYKLLENKNKLDTIKSAILFDYYKINDTIYELKNLPYYEKVGYKKHEIHSSLFKEIDKVFCHKTGGSTMGAACIYEYRDILVFKKESKVVAISKICLGCYDINLNWVKDVSEEDLGIQDNFVILDKVFKKSKTSVNEI